MSSFEETLARMKGLITYGNEINTNNNINEHTLEYHTIAADGKSYGIIKECNKYYIKSAPKSKEMVAEAYDYIGGFCNKKNYEYTSYNKALKNFELKIASVNEAFDGNVKIETLDPFRKNDVIIEGTKKMQDELARVRQIMHNAAMIMNEESFKPVMGDKAKNGAKQPEAETGDKGCEGMKDAKPNPGYTGSNKGPGGKGPNENAGPYTNKVTSEGKCCKKCGKCGDECCCGKCNEETGDIGDNPLMPKTRNWGTEGIGKGKDPHNNGWDMEDQEMVREETREWDEGLPSSAGGGVADNSHNNDPFNKSINEEDEFDNSEDTDFDAGLDDFPSNDEEGDEFNDEEGDEFASDEEGDEFSSDEEGDEFNDEEGDEFASDEEGDEFNDEEGDEFASDEEGDEFNDEEGDEFNDEEGDEFASDEEGDEFNDEEGDEFNDEEGDDEGDEFGDEGNDFDDYESDEYGNDFNDEEGNEFSDEFGDDEGDEFGDEGNDFNDYESDEYDETGDKFGDEYDDEEGEVDECGITPNQMMESKRAKMDRIIESVVNRILKEDELHVFGKHPGYRKKPMELPATGEDQNKWGRDWNDDSVHNEEPFGKQIGNGDPFTELVNKVTNDVMYQLKHGIPIDNKKKAE